MLRIIVIWWGPARTDVWLVDGQTSSGRTAFLNSGRIALCALHPSLPPSRSERATCERQIHGNCVGIGTFEARDRPMKLMPRWNRYSAATDGRPQFFVGRTFM